MDGKTMKKTSSAASAIAIPSIEGANDPVATRICIAGNAVFACELHRFSSNCIEDIYVVLSCHQCIIFGGSNGTLPFFIIYKAG